MPVTEIEKRAKLITDRSGKPVEVILPYNVYKHLLELETSMDILKSRKTQASIKKARADVKAGRSKSFGDVKEAIKWLDG
ncbi:hypothetical protein LCGC14_2303780 [marine sediment metagenome]|uniref:Prevent-host-death family protein n=1 Tax=marine sediment metagenome TaxID=412755 RepID=A0A0F9DA60_9ZZZZ